MITVQIYSPDKQNEWDSVVNFSRTPMFMFTRGFMDYHADRFKDASLIFYNEDVPIAVFPASRHEEEIRSHGGLTYGGVISKYGVKQHLMAECFQQMIKIYKQMGGHSVMYKKIPFFYSLHPAEDDIYELFRNGGVIEKVEPATVINLNNMFSKSKGRKAQISRARREGVEIKLLNDMNEFITLENEVLLNRHGVKAVHSASELQLLKARFPSNIQCYGGYYKGVLIAATLLFVYEKVIHVQYLAANDVARRIGALDFIIDELINKSVGKFDFFDFGISSEKGGLILNDGLIAQKESFGGRTVCYKTWRLPLDN